MEGKSCDCLGSYLSLCSPFRFEAPWDCLSADPAAFRGPSSPPDALAHLAEHHAAEDLIASGLVQVGDNKALAIHPSLAEPDVVVLALRHSAFQRVMNLVTNNGCVHGSDLPLFASLHDDWTLNGIQWQKRTALFLTSTLEDAILLRSMGMAASPVVGLERLGKKGVEQLCNFFGLTKSVTTLERDAAYQSFIADEERRLSRSCSTSQRATSNSEQPRTCNKSTVAKHQFKLTLTNWSPTQLSLAIPEHIRSAKSHLAALLHFCQLSTSNTAEWLPEQKEFDGIRFAVTQREPDWIHDAVIESWFKSEYERAKHKAQQVSPPPPDMRDVLQRLYKIDPLESGEKAISRQKQAMLEYDQVVRQESIGGLLREAQNTADPVKRTKLVQLAQLHEIAQELFSELRPCAQISKKSAGRLNRSLASGGKDPISPYLKVTNQIQMLAHRLSK